ncbi:aminopeptidase N, partial [Escherichia coli]|nr:aminopeptidase N [Escherichia coli]
HTITDIDLTFDLYDNDTIVTALSKVVQKGESTTLELDGEGLELRSVKVNGEDWAHHEVKEASLVLSDLPAEFELEIITKIDPEANTALE